MAKQDRLQVGDAPFPALGAAQAFDYRSEDVVVRDIIAVVRGETVAGALAIEAGSVLECLDILVHCQGRKFVANCSSDIAFGALPQGPQVTLPTILKLLPARLRATAETRRKSRRYGITATFFDASLVINNAIGPAIYRDCLGPALAERRFRPAPSPKVVGHGLQAIQTALDIQRRGVSPTKIVVALD